MRTRGDLLRFSIAFALLRARKVVRGLRQGLTEQERYAVADDAVYELQKHGDPWRLSEPLPDKTGAGHSTPSADLLMVQEVGYAQPRKPD